MALYTVCNAGPSLVLMCTRTSRTVWNMVLCVTATVRRLKGANLAGCRGQREQSTVGPHQGATLNLAACWSFQDSSTLLAILAVVAAIALHNA